MIVIDVNIISVGPLQICESCDEWSCAGTGLLAVQVVLLHIAVW